MILLSILTDVSGTAPGGVYVDQDIIEVIRQDHEQIMEVLDDLEAHGRATSETCSTARGLLYSHMHGKEATIYERMRSEMGERIEDSLDVPGTIVRQTGWALQQNLTGPSANTSQSP